MGAYNSSHSHDRLHPTIPLGVIHSLQNSRDTATDSYSLAEAMSFTSSLSKLIVAFSRSNKNQITGTNFMPHGYQYDTAGNVTNDGVNTYLYDAEGRMCAAQSKSISGGVAMVEYIYDAEGHRVAQGTISPVAPGQLLSCNLSTNGIRAGCPIQVALGLSGRRDATFGDERAWTAFSGPQFKGSLLPRPTALDGLGSSATGIPDKNLSLQDILGQP